MRIAKYTLRFYLSKASFILGWGIPAWFLVPVAETARIAHKVGLEQQNFVVRFIMTMGFLGFIYHLNERKQSAKYLSDAVDTALSNGDYGSNEQGSVVLMIPLWTVKMLHNSFNTFRNYASTRAATFADELYDLEVKKHKTKKA